MKKVILLTAMPKESVWSSSIYVNGGGKIAFCVKHNLISTFFNFVFYCTLVFIMCFLTAGNICAQTTLPLTANDNINADVNGTLVTFKDDGTDPLGWICYSCVGGANWATTWTPGQTHTFTVTLNNYTGDDLVGKLYIAALDCVINKSDDRKSYSSNIVAQAWIDPRDNNVLTLEVNSSYEAVYLFKKNREGEGHDWEKVDIASVTRTVSLATPVDIRESEDNTITAKNNATVNLYRSLTANTWNTICLPFAPTQAHVDAIFGEGAKFAQFSSVSNGVMQFTSVDVKDLHAGTPYLVLPSQPQTASSPIVLTGVNITATSAGYVTIDGYTFQGIYSPTPFAKGDWYKIRFVAAGNKLKYPSTENPNNENESTPLKALRAYFILPVASPAKDYFYDVDSFVPTSIANIQIEGDGDGAIYNIGGQRVEGKSLPKGIYIRDGKKFVVK